jgi:glycerol uptake facilitator protein
MLYYPEFLKTNMKEFLGELIGTALLMLFGTGVTANVTLKKTLGNKGDWMIIGFGWGLAVFVGVLVAGPVSGAHINPAVSIGLAVANKFDWAMVPVYITAQMLGAFIGSGLAYLTYLDHFKLTQQNTSTLGIFATGPAIRNYRNNFLTEAIGTFALVYCVFYLVDGDGLGSLNAFPVGLIVMAIGLSLGGATGYAINPARDLAPRIFHSIFVSRESDWKYAWVPILGPVTGAIVAAGVFLIIEQYSPFLD